MFNSRRRSLFLYLKTLDIAGFKSFARPARLEFPPGVAALVGPNGSGKSNVVDAIRWCLGEQSMRDLRGQRAEDVIYAGPRQVLGRAEVSLTFSESAGSRSSAGEITVSRRLFRSGESDYLVDGQKSRLRDVLDALRGIGIDSSRHIVVTQGMADALLSASPAERRTLLEQAAGLGMYRARRDEARQKLATAEHNIATIEAVLQELEPRLRVLRRQARAMQDRDEACAILRSSLADWFAARWSNLSSQLTAVESEAAGVTERRIAIESELGRIEREAEVSHERERDWQRRVDMLAAAHRAVERDHEASARRQSEVELSLRSLYNQLASTQTRRERLEEALLHAGTRRDAVESLLTARSGDLESLDARICELQEQCNRASVRAEHARHALQTKQTEASEAEAALAHARRRIDELGDKVESIAQRTRDGHNWLTSSRSELARLSEEHTVVSARAREVRDTLWHRQRSLHTAEAKGADLRARAGRLDALVLRVRNAANEVTRRGEAVQRNLQAHDRELHALLDDLVIQPGWDTAVSAALGGWAYAGSGDARSVELHKWESEGFAEWQREVERAVGVTTWAMQLVEGLKRGVSSPLAATIFVETHLEAARVWNQVKGLAAHRIGSPPLQVVTREGERWDAVGVDSCAADDRAAEYLRLRRQYAALRGHQKHLSVRLETIGAARTLAVEATTDHEEQIESLLREIRTLGRELTELDRRDDDLNNRIADLKTKLESRKAEMAVLGSESAAALAQRLELEQNTRQLSAHAGELRRSLDSDTLETRLASETHMRLVSELTELRQQRHLLAAKNQAQIELRDALMGESDRLAADVEISAAERAELEQQVQLRQSDALELTQQTEELAEASRAHEERLSQARAAKPPDLSPIDELRQTRREMTEIVGHHERVQAQVAHLRERAEELRRDIYNELHIEPTDLPARPQHVPTDADIRRLRARASQYADVDESVVEEAHELAERHAYLRSHVEDLQAAAGTLREMMRVADAEMRVRFETAFRAVSQEFSRVFEVMLRGGQARLEQVDDGGIEVLAQLPGKRSRSSAAFSGGERALVASSLLFGVLRIRPTPFCVLDEVDAALDETNVDRYLAALRDIARQTQAIVVTHNRATMAEADVLYGLTMDAAGASNLLSLRLDSYAAG